MSDAFPTHVTIIQEEVVFEPASSELPAYAYMHKYPSGDGGRLFIHYGEDLEMGPALHFGQLLRHSY